MNQEAFIKCRNRIFEIFLQRSFSEKSGNIICFLPVTDFIDTSDQVDWLLLIVTYDIATAVDPDWFPVKIQPAVFHIMCVPVCVEQIIQFRFQKRIIVFVHEFFKFFCHIMEFISRQTETIQSLWSNIEKVGSEIQDI